MRIDAEDLATGKKFTGEAKKLTDEDIRELNDFRIPELRGTERDVDRYIDNLKIPGGLDVEKWADARVKLKEMSKVIIQVGQFVIYVGRKLLECVRYVSKKYPNATIGFIFGAIVGGLVSMIPVIGFLIGGLAQIIVPLIGAAIGLKADLEDREDRDLKQTIQKEIHRFRNLNTN